MTSPVNILAIVRDDGERYVFLFDDANRQATLRKLGEYASNPELSFTWYDAAILSRKMRKMKPTSRFHKLENYY